MGRAAAGRHRPRDNGKDGDSDPQSPQAADLRIICIFCDLHSCSLRYYAHSNPCSHHGRRRNLSVALLVSMSCTSCSMCPPTAGNRAEVPGDANVSCEAFPSDATPLITAPEPSASLRHTLAIYGTGTSVVFDVVSSLSTSWHSSSVRSVDHKRGPNGEMVGTGDRRGPRRSRPAPSPRTRMWSGCATGHRRPRRPRPTSHGARPARAAGAPGAGPTCSCPRPARDGTGVMRVERSAQRGDVPR